MGGWVEACGFVGCLVSFFFRPLARGRGSYLSICCWVPLVVSLLFFLFVFRATRGKVLATVTLLFFYLLKERVIAGGTKGVSKMGSRVLHCFPLVQSIVLLQGTEQLQAQVVKASLGDGVGGGWVG